MAGLPEGFTIDESPKPSGLPEGFTIDQPATWNPATWKPAEGPAAFITDVPREAAVATGEALTGIKEGLDPRQHQIQPWDPSRGIGENLAEQASQQWGRFKRAGSGLASAVGAPFAPAVGAARSILGHPLAETVGASRRALGEPDKGPEETYKEAKEGVDLAMMGLRAAPRAPVTVPPRPAVPEFGVNLSRGQETGELAAIQREQAALRNQMGDPALRHAQEFKAQQEAQLAQAQEGVARNLDPYGVQIAENPQQAGALVQDALKQEATNRKAAVDAAYEAARSMPGEVHASALEGIGQKIKGDLTLGDKPVIIDDVTTPFASKAIQDIDKHIGQMRIQNRADPFGQPSPENIVGVDLRGLDQVRKRLTAFRDQAYGHSATDGRAASAVVRSFDKKIDEAISSGQFTGDQLAQQAFWDARAAHADYKSTFAKGRKDPIGGVIEKILGRASTVQETPNAVADFLYGSSGVNPNSTTVGVASRVKNILGDQSPEWIGAKQGLFQRIVSRGEGTTDFGPKTIADRITKFIHSDGRELSDVMFSPAEKQLMLDYATLLRKLQIPQAGAQWSNNAGPIVGAVKHVADVIAGAIGAGIGHMLAPGLGEIAGGAAGYASSKIVGNLRGAMNARAISREMPLVNEQIKQWQKAVTAANRANASPVSQSALAAASANLAQALERIGIRGQTSPLQIPAPSRAEENNQNIPRPPSQQKRGGRIEQKPKLSHLPLARRMVAKA